MKKTNIHHQSFAGEDNLYKLLFNESENIQLLLDKSGKIKESNSKAIEFYGYSREQFMELSLKDIEPAEGKNKNKPNKNKTINRINYNAIHVTKSGEEINVSVKSSKIIFNKESYIHFIVKEAEKETDDISSESEKNLMLESFFESPGEEHAIVEIRDKRIYFLRVNSTFANIIGRSKDEIAGKYHDEIAGEIDTTKSILPYYKEARKSKTPVKFEFISGVRKKKTYLSSLITFLGIHNGYPRFSQIVSDIAETKLAEEKINYTANRYQTILSNLQHGIVIASENETVEFLNIAFLKMFNLKKPLKEYIGLSSEEFIRAIINEYEDSGEVIEYIKGTIKNNTAVYGEEVKMKNDRTFLVDYSPLTFNGENRGRIWIHRDITNLKNYERELNISNEKYSKLFYLSPYVSILTEIETGKILEYNNELLRITGYTDDEVRGKTTQELKLWYNPKGRDKVVETLKKGIKIVNQEEYFRSKSGEKIAGLFSSEVIKVGGNNYVLSSINDITNYKNTSIALSEREEQYKLLFNGMLEGFALHEIICDEEGTPIDYRFIEINPSFEKYTGLVRDKTIGKTVLEVLPDTEKIWIEKYGEVALTGKAIEFEEYTKSLDKYFRVRVFSPEYKKFAVIFEDVTEKRKSQLNLIESESRYRILAENINDVIWTMSAEGKFLYVSPSIEKLRGYTAREVMEENLVEALTDESFRKVNKIMLTFFENLKKGDANTSSLLEIEQPCKDGSIVQVEILVKPVFDKKNNFLFFLGVSRDITSRKESEKKLLESQSELQIIFDASPSVMILINKDAEILQMNNSGKKYFEESVPGFNIEKTGDALKCINALNKNNGCGNSNGCIECPIRLTILESISETADISKREMKYYRLSKTGDKEERTILLSTTVVKKDNDLKLLLTIDDISDRKNLEKELIVSKENAEEMNRLKSSFLANMSHELRTPMVGILGFSELLMTEIKDDNLKVFAEMINKGGTRLMETLNLILDLSLLESNKLNLRLSEFDIITELEETVNNFQAQAEKKNIYLKFEKSIISKNINQDVRLIKQVLNNVINNAVKFTAKGGVTVEIKETTDKDFVVIRVKDTGIGMPSDKQKYIWDEFRQISEGHSRKYEGAGLGLSISKKFVEKLNGVIEIEESLLGKGTTMKILIPSEVKIQNENEKTKFKLQDLFIKNEPIENINQSVSKEKPLFLYVEDDPDAPILVTEYTKEYCNLDLAISGEDAIKKAQEKIYSGILMDINLGSGINGLIAAKIIRKIKGYANIPIAAITAFAMESEKEEFLNNGCTHYLSKPFEAIKLKNLVISMLKDSRKINN